MPARALARGCSRLRGVGEDLVYLNTLYLTSEDAYLNLEGETVVVTISKERRLQVPLHHLQSLVLHETVRISAPLLIKCVESGLSIVWLKRGGRFGARMEGATSGNVLLRVAQWRAHADITETANLAREFIRGKLVNLRTVLMRASRESSDAVDRDACQEAARRVANAQSALDRTTDLDELRGREGEASAAYFGAFTHLVKPQFRRTFPFRCRQRRPPPDPINCLLSYVYALLLADCRGALETVGLDPQIGYLHCIRPGRPSLALDLIEEFRPILGDRLVLTLINRGQLGPADFQYRPGGSVELSEAARKLVIQSYQERKKETIQHPFLKDPVPVGVLPQLQARLLARSIRKDLAIYTPFRYR
jgi:CRISPR-associated protein Cas1